MTETGGNLLGTYLKDRRAKLDPASFGLPLRRRRTPGLRREETLLLRYGGRERRDEDHGDRGADQAHQGRQGGAASAPATSSRSCSSSPNGSSA